MSLWVGLGIAAFLLLLGMLGLLGGGFVVFQQMRKRNASRAARARRALEEAMPVPTPSPVPARAPKAQAVSFSSAATDPRGGDVTVPREKPAPPAPAPAPAAPAPAAAASSPTLLPDVDDFEDDVPTGVFRPSQYQDIDAMMKEADKYVSSHRKGS